MEKRCKNELYSISHGIHGLNKLLLCICPKRRMVERIRNSILCFCCRTRIHKERERSVKMSKKRLETFCGLSIVESNERDSGIADGWIKWNTGFLEERSTPEHRIYVNRHFWALPERIQKAMLWHEMGHYRDKNMNIRQYILDEDYKLEKEIIAELAACRQGYALECLKHLREALERSLALDPTVWDIDYPVLHLTQRMLAVIRFIRGEKGKV